MPSLSDQRWGLMPFSPGLRGTGLTQEDTGRDFPVFLNSSSLLSFPAGGDRTKPTEETANNYCIWVSSCRLYSTTQYQGHSPSIFFAQGCGIGEPEGLARRAEQPHVLPCRARCGWWAEKITALEGHLIRTSLAKGIEKKHLTGKSSNVILSLPFFHLPPFGFFHSLWRKKMPMQ